MALALSSQSVESQLVEPPAPQLTIQILAGPQVKLSWPASASRFTLEEASELADAARWQAVTDVPSREGEQLAVRLAAREVTRFFRLRAATALSLTTLSATSPARGESGVAVTRETILHFSEPLAPTTTIRPDQLYAEFGGRRLLSRVELSTDRRTVTLFYLERLPASAHVRVTLLSDTLFDAQGLAVDGDGDGRPGGSATIDFETLSLTAVPATAMIGKVFASELAPGPQGTTNSVNRPLAGVTISVDGAEQDLRTVTKADGTFVLAPCPAGRFFVLVDGRTAVGSEWPNGAYYAFVGKAWDAVAGRSNNLAGGTGEIFLPLIAADTLQPVSMSQDTPITFPSEILQKNPHLAGVTITVPANSLYSNDGVRGGRVGIAAVPPDRIPEPLPQGLNFPLVITIQTDGPSNFDRPVPVRFPNLPDPVTGKALPPGAKSALWSFNHDTGRWEIQGPMTVSADGKFVESDPGVGVRQPGWHGSQPGSGGSGGDGGDDGDDDNDDDDDDEPPPKECEPSQMPSLARHAIRKHGPPRIDYSQWTTTIDDMPDTAVRNISFLPPTGTVFFDRGSGCWKYRITGPLISRGDVHLSRTGYAEPNPVPGGNVTAQNYCAIINTLSGYHTNGWGVWHTLEASRAHEHYHRDVDIPYYLGQLWPETAMRMQLQCVPRDLEACEARRLLEREAQDRFTDMVNEFQATWNAFVDLHNVHRDDGAYQAGQTVLNQLIMRIRDFANQQNFPPCPGNALQAHAATSPAPSVPTLINLSATIPPGLMDVGGSVPITVQGVFSDGRTVDLTAGANGTTYLATDLGVVSVNTNGVVKARSPGRTLVMGYHSRGLHQLPFLAAVEIVVRSPDDTDDDGRPNAYELANGLNPNDPNDGLGDLDGDGLRNEDEFRYGSSPINADSDNDGFTDGVEVVRGSRPARAHDSPPVVRTGLYYYLLIDLETGRIVRRDKAHSTGSLHNNLILAADTRYRHLVLRAKTLSAGSVDFRSSPVGTSFRIPVARLHKSNHVDTDGDGLPDDGEYIVGTDPNKPDSDGDGVMDGAEVQQGTDPLDGQTVAIGIIASVDTPGNAVDVCTINNLAVLADGEGGISLFNIADPFNPTVIARVPTPGRATAVACSGNFVAVADSKTGLLVLDIADPPNARILRQLRFHGIETVAADGRSIYAGSESGDLFVVDLSSGVVLDRLKFTSAVQDLAVESDQIFVLTGTDLRIYRSLSDGPQLLGSAAVQGEPSPLEVGRKLFVGGGRAYVGYFTGFSVFDVSDPSAPKLIGSPLVTQAAIHNFTANGSGLGVAVTSFAGEDTLALSLYDLSDPTDLTRFLGSFETPGIPRSVALFNGLAYVADSQAGLQVINYLEYDRLGRSPTIRLTTPFEGNSAEEGKNACVSAIVTDDVQVANVEFHLDGRRLATDGNFPFELRFTTPRRSDQSSFTLRAKATDTGGNIAWSDLLAFNLAPATPPPEEQRVYWTRDADGFWDDPANWSTGAVPSAGDIVVIDRPGGDFTITHRSELTTIKSLLCKEALHLASGVLYLKKASEINGNLTISGGTLDGIGDLTVGGLLTWTGGTIEGWGTVQAQKGILISSGPGKALLGRTLRNAGSATISGGFLNVGDDAVFHHLPGATCDVQTDFQFGFGGLRVGSVQNDGLFRKSGGTGPVDFFGVAFNNSGTVEIQSGSLLLRGGGSSSGAFTGAAGTKLDFDSGGFPYPLSGSSRLEFPEVIFTGGTVDVSGTYTASESTKVIGGTVDFNGTVNNLGTDFIVRGGAANFNTAAPISRSTLTLSGGQLGGSGTIIFNGLITWSSGGMTGSGRTVANGGIEISGPLSKALSDRTIDNAGLAVWSGSGSLQGRAAVFNNLPGATFECRHETDVTWRPSQTAGTFNNAGTLRKLNGTGMTIFNQVVLNNTGSIELQSGGLTFSGGGTSSGLLDARVGTRLRFGFPNSIPSTNTLAASSRLISAGAVEFSGDTCHVEGAYSVTGSTTVNGGTANFTGAVEGVGDSLTISNGVANFSSPAGITTKEIALLSGTLTGSSSVTATELLHWSGGYMTGAGRSVAQGGLVIDGPFNKILDTRTLENAGAATWGGNGGDLLMINGARLHNLGGASFEIQIDKSFTGVGGGAATAATINNAGLFRKSGGTGATAFNRITFLNSGTVEARSGTLNFVGGYAQTAGLTSLAGGNIASTGALDIQGGRLSGVGTISAPVSNAGVIGPGASAGLLTITGNYTQIPSGVLNIEISGRTSTVDFDVLTTSRRASLGGALNIERLNGFEPNLRDTFRIMNCSSRVGQFATVNGLDIGNGKRFQLRYGTDNLTLEVVAVSSAPGKQ